MSDVFVTGGSGVVGGAVVRHLVAAGHEVRALSRSGSSDRLLTGLGATPIRGDVLRPGIASGMAGADVVYHVAGLNAMCVSDPGPMMRTNLDGSLNVVDAARRAGVTRLVYTSSAATIGEQAGTVGVETSTHRGWYLSEYERSKHLAEQAVLRQSGIDIVSVNPSSVQGPGRATGTAALILRLIRGQLPGLVDTDLSIVDIDDCARGHLLAAQHGVAGERYLLSSFAMGMREAVGVIESVLGRELSVRFLPGWMASVGAMVVETASWVARRPPVLCREMVRTLRHGHRYDGSRAVRELGLRYSEPGEMLGRLIQWFRSEGMLDPDGGVVRG